MSETDVFGPLLEARLRQACADLRARLRARLPGRVEEVLSQDAELAGNPEAVLELIYAEWTTREELGEPPERAERLVKWVRRHPVVAALSAVLVGGAAASVTSISLLWLRAEGALADREAALRDLRDEKKKVEWNLSRLQLAAARQAWTADNLDEARRLLDECDPALRDDDWRALHRACHALRHVSPVLPTPPVFVAFGSDDQAVVAMAHGGAYFWHRNSPDPPRPFEVPLPCHGLSCTGDRQVVLLSVDIGRVDLIDCSLADGKVLRKLTFEGALDFGGFARLSPDGRRMALVRFQKEEIEVLDLRGGPSRKLKLKSRGRPCRSPSARTDAGWRPSRPTAWFRGTSTPARGRSPGTSGSRSPAWPSPRTGPPQSSETRSRPAPPKSCWWTSPPGRCDTPWCSRGCSTWP